METGVTHRRALLYILCLTAVLAPLVHAQYDLNGNETIDLPLIKVKGDQLQWSGQDLVTDEIIELGTFGHPAYQVNIGYWSSFDILTRVFVYENEFGGFELHAEGSTSVYSLGQSRDDAVVILGRDIDSSGLQDAVLINGDRSKWAWKFSLNPLSTHGNKRRILYGRKSYTPFLFRNRGTNDSLGLLMMKGKRTKILYRPLRGRRKRQIRLSGFTHSDAQQPLLIRDSKGRDSFGFTEKGKLTIYSNRGKKNQKTRAIPSNGSLLVGDFDLDGADNIVTYSEGRVTFENGIIKHLHDENVEPLNSMHTVKYTGPSISPTLIPVRTLFPTPSLTPVSATLHTAIPSPTTSQSVTPTFTSIPTYTFQPTYTAAPTVTPQLTFTSQPTYTAVPPAATYTPYPTFTATSTVIATATNTPVPTPVITGTPLVSSSIKADCNAHRAAGETSDGLYWVDPDGHGFGVDPAVAYCDMTIDNGGWTLVLNYLHRGGTNPNLSLKDALPLLGSTVLGSDESGTDFWGHSKPAYLDNFSISELRFYCKSDSNSGRILHFKTTDTACIDYFSTGVGGCSGLKTNNSLYSGLTSDLNHTANLPLTMNGNRTSEGNLAMTQFSFFRSGLEHFAVRSTGSGQNWWSCDDNGREGPSTYHQIWIR